MDRQVAEMNNEEIEEEIKQLEDAYAIILSSSFDQQSLHKIWNRIKELRLELINRNSPTAPNN